MGLTRLLYHPKRPPPPLFDCDDKADTGPILVADTAWIVATAVKDAFALRDR